MYHWPAWGVPCPVFRPAMGAAASKVLGAALYAPAPFFGWPWKPALNMCARPAECHHIRRDQG